jgi:hypothetical protein
MKMMYMYTSAENQTDLEYRFICFKVQVLLVVFNADCLQAERERWGEGEV